jgi:hypothetical protein
VGFIPKNSARTSASLVHDDPFSWIVHKAVGGGVKDIEGRDVLASVDPNYRDSQVFSLPLQHRINSHASGADASPARLIVGNDFAGLTRVATKSLPLRWPGPR